MFSVTAQMIQLATKANICIFPHCILCFGFQSVASIFFSRDVLAVAMHIPKAYVVYEVRIDDILIYSVRRHSMV